MSPPPASPSPSPAPAPAPVAALPFDVGGRGRPPALLNVETLNDTGKHREAKAELLKILSAESELEPHVRLHARAALGRAEAALHQVTRANAEYTKVLTLSSRSRLASLPHDARAHAVYAVGEAHFHFAEQELAVANKITLAPLTGAKDQQAVEKYVGTTFKAWFTEKRQALDGVEKAYAKILRIEPPPPGWVVAAAARVGDMWFDFAESFRNAPYPSLWDSEGFVPNTDPPMLYIELRAIYLKAVEDALSPTRERANAAYRQGADLAERFGVKSPYAARCVAQRQKEKPSR